MRYKIYFHSEKREVETVTASFYTTDKHFVTFFNKILDNDETPVASYKTKTVSKVKLVTEE